MTEDEQAKKIIAQVTESINKWMLETYPLFDEKLASKIEQLSGLKKEIDLSFHNHRINVANDKKEILEYFKSEINKFLSNDFPDLSPRLSLLTKELEKAYEKQKKVFKETDSQSKLLLKGSSLYQDVYKIRDDFNEFKREFDSFTRKMKNLFGAK